MQNYDRVRKNHGLWKQALNVLGYLKNIYVLFFTEDIEQNIANETNMFNSSGIAARQWVPIALNEMCGHDFIFADGNYH